MMAVISAVEGARTSKRRVFAEELAEMVRGRPKALPPLRVLYSHLNGFDYVTGEVADVEVSWGDGVVVTVMLDDGTIKDFAGTDPVFIAQ